MNPDRIYRQHRDNALAKQITATKYTTFVAMPFGDRYSYRSREIYEKLIKEAAIRATKLEKAKRPFDKPRRVDDEPSTAKVITEDIVVSILESHIFIGDLTFENPGVVLEVGVALGLKPNKQIILIMQGSDKDLHFDIRNNRVVFYSQSNAVEQIANAMIAGANAFEADCKKHIESISQTLSPDAILCLNWYGIMRRDNPGVEISLHQGTIPKYYNGNQVRFREATLELLSKKLIWTDYQVGAIPLGDAWGMHATELGWAVIENMWKDLRRPKS
ncbi:MAG: hypothetical protein P8123_00885 [bacterium]